MMGNGIAKVSILISALDPGFMKHCSSFVECNPGKHTEHTRQSKWYKAISQEHIKFLIGRRIGTFSDEVRTGNL